MEYFWADDSQALLIPASGNLYYFSLVDNSVTQLPIGEGFRLQMHAYRPKGILCLSCGDQNLYVLESGDEKLQAMTTDGGGVIKMPWPGLSLRRNGSHDRLLVGAR